MINDVTYAIDDKGGVWIVLGQFAEGEDFYLTGVRAPIDRYGERLPESRKYFLAHSFKEARQVSSWVISVITGEEK